MDSVAYVAWETRQGCYSSREFEAMEQEGLDLRA